eukprot:CAMPEP_0205803890 /NCGR_PEP_ID=MMETSP0205-20121125/6645_1 /ASSEMBLY_ACC=CAM_ASM_000278 /TAXON_ID=36767 /ORGANISM="Euplotes focardii, Strain TN1" /LENGTH=34 /DNA_ID= /DNA_START= /DNA_END= /DNA_ORIENTATION=
MVLEIILLNILKEVEEAREEDIEIEVEAEAEVEA